MSTAVLRRWRLALVAVALVGGLFALHALSHHGEHLPSVTTTAHSDHGPATPADGPDHDGSGAMTMCVAMLLGAAAIWLAGGVRRRLARPTPVLGRQLSSVVGRPVTGRAHGPPDRWVLSVCRC